ncbi:uncharacterized protein [Arachis hypogaea]|uniref:uncharacterized protein n=1 Tax=Arachis hypogaea TaxID=3818 RepID=UPI000DECE982|nr:uncharacterized protein LOC112723539 [Arachis hypogaea]
MADFLVEVTGDPTEETGTRWRVHVDGASNQKSEGAGVILESPAGVIYEQSTKFEFPVSNNQVEYEALLGGLALAREVGVTRLEVCSDSQVITRFSIPEVVISDNGTQFNDKKFIEFLNGLGIKQKFSSVEHPQTNGQVESANKVILQGLKKRLGDKKVHGPMNSLQSFGLTVQLSSPPREKPLSA